MPKVNEEIISVIINSYNFNDKLGLILQSVIEQTYNNLQIILSDAGSTSEKKIVLNNFKMLDNRIQVLHSDEYIGLVGSLTNAIKIVKGKFFILLHQDDILPLNYIESMTKFIDEKTSIVFTSDNLIDENGINFRNVSFLEKIYYLVPHAYLAIDNISTIGIMINSSLANKIGLFYKNYLEVQSGRVKGFDEWKTWVDLSEHGKVIYNPNVQSHYRQHADNIRKIYTEEDTYVFLKDAKQIKRKALSLLWKRYKFLFIPIVIFYMFPIKLAKLFKRRFL